MLSGLVVSSLYVGAPAHLLGSVYGRTLMVKLALVAGAAWCGYLNWRDLHGTSTAIRIGRHKTEDLTGTRGASRAPLSVPQRVTRELTLAMLVILVTGALTNLAHP